MKNYAFYNSEYGKIKIGYEDNRVICVKRVKEQDCVNAPNQFSGKVYKQETIQATKADRI